MPTADDLSHGFHLYRHGTAWCAIGPKFENVHVSVIGFGDTMCDACNEHWKQLSLCREWQSHERPPFYLFKVWDEQ
jgi:hypothetical protein